MYSRNQQELNLVNFHSSFLAPSRALEGLHVLTSESDSRRIFDHLSSALLFEAGGWLSTGALFGFFHPADARASIEGIQAQQRGLEAFTRDWNYLLDSEWQAHLGPSVEVRTLALPSLSGAEKLEAGGRIFEALYLRCQQLNRSACAQQATAILSFERPDVRARLLERGPTIEDLSHALASDMTEAARIVSHQYLSAADLFAGFGKMLAFIETFQRVGIRVAEAEHEHRELAIALTRKMSQLLGWRFFFLETETCDPQKDPDLS